MKSYNTNQIKNIVLLGNYNSGKTTLAEAMMFEGRSLHGTGNGNPVPTLIKRGESHSRFLHQGGKKTTNHG